MKTASMINFKANDSEGAYPSENVEAWRALMEHLNQVKKRSSFNLERESIFLMRLFQ